MRTERRPCGAGASAGAAAAEALNGAPTLFSFFYFSPSTPEKGSLTAQALNFSLSGPPQNYPCLLPAFFSCLFIYLWQEWCQMGGLAVRVCGQWTRLCFAYESENERGAVALMRWQSQRGADEVTQGRPPVQLVRSCDLAFGLMYTQKQSASDLYNDAFKLYHPAITGLRGIDLWLAGRDDAAAWYMAPFIMESLWNGGLWRLRSSAQNYDLLQLPWSFLVAFQLAASRRSLKP